jgi:hypothetical protein
LVPKNPLSKDGYHLTKQYILVNGWILIYLSGAFSATKFKQFLGVCVASDNNVENEAYLYSHSIE